MDRKKSDSFFFESLLEVNRFKPTNTTDQYQLSTQLGNKMSVKITTRDLFQVKLFVELCDKLGKDYKTHHSLQRKVQLQEEQGKDQENTKSVYETATDAIASATLSLYTWWSSWGTKEAKQKEVTEVTKESCIEEKVAEILVAILEERAEEVALRRDTHTVLYDGCEC